MDMREFETRYYVNAGLNKIRSKVFKALIDKQSYSMKDVVNITSVQFYVTPILNAMIRVGNMDDKDLLFRAFVETDEVFKYKKRGSNEETDEDIYTRAARLCSNAKSRQTKEVTKGVNEIENIIEKNNINKNQVFFFEHPDLLLAFCQYVFHTILHYKDVLNMNNCFRNHLAMEMLEAAVTEMAYSHLQSYPQYNQIFQFLLIHCPRQFANP